MSILLTSLSSNALYCISDKESPCTGNENILCTETDSISTWKIKHQSGLKLKKLTFLKPLKTCSLWSYWSRITKESLQKCTAKIQISITQKFAMLIKPFIFWFRAPDTTERDISNSANILTHATQKLLAPSIVWSLWLLRYTGKYLLLYFRQIILVSLRIHILTPVCSKHVVSLLYESFSNLMDTRDQRISRISWRSFDFQVRSFSMEPELIWNYSSTNSGLSNSSHTTTEPSIGEETLKWTNAEIARLIQIISRPILIILGTAGNGLSFYIMRRTSLKDVSSCFYMSILALADTSKSWGWH